VLNWEGYRRKGQWPFVFLKKYFRTHNRVPCKYRRNEHTMYDSVSSSFRTGSITKYTLTFGTTRSEAAQRVMAAKLTRLTHKIAAQLHVVAESCTIYSSRSRRPVRKLLDTTS
jgi:hypothetical protein